MDVPNPLLIAAAFLSAIAALLHVGILLFGPSWYRFFGAGKRMVRLAEAGSWIPAVITLFIIAVLSTWALYAFAAAGSAFQLPWEKAVLSIITAIYLLRGVAVLPVLALSHQKITPFWIWSSAICTLYGVVHLAGLYQRWSAL